jgi:hypothetical protein
MPDDQSLRAFAAYVGPNSTAGIHLPLKRRLASARNWICMKAHTSQAIKPLN